jgi:hypothetical protein
MSVRDVFTEPLSGRLIRDYVTTLVVTRELRAVPPPQRYYTAISTPHDFIDDLLRQAIEAR